MTTKIAARCLGCLCFILTCCGSATGEGVHHYVFFNRDRERISDAAFLETKAVEGRTVQERFHKLLVALGKEFDGKVEGINLAETAVSFGESGRLFPKGFTPAIYRDAVLTNMIALKRAFPKSVAMQYANFMPGEWLPGKDKSYLRSVYQRAKESNIGVGGPDLLPYKPGQMSHCYPLLKECAGSTPTGIAVQQGNYAHKNPKTAKRMIIAELVGFATEYLKVDYLFWCNEEPFYSEELIPFLRLQK